MKLYQTETSPYARLVRTVIHEKGLGDRITIEAARTRQVASPYYRVNPSGRVPYLVRDDGQAIEDSQLICRYLDSLDGSPRLHPEPSHQDWAYGRLESYARSLLDGLAVYVREMRRPEAERSPTTLGHETERAVRLADFWEREIGDPMMQGNPNMAQLILVVALDAGRTTKIAELEAGRAQLSAWAARMRERPSVKATAPKAG